MTRNQRPQCSREIHRGTEKRLAGQQGPPRPSARTTEKEPHQRDPTTHGRSSRSSKQHRTDARPIGTWRFYRGRTQCPPHQHSSSSSGVGIRTPTNAQHGSFFRGRTQCPPCVAKEPNGLGYPTRPRTQPAQDRAGWRATAIERSHTGVRTEQTSPKPDEFASSHVRGVQPCQRIPTTFPLRAGTENSQQTRTHRQADIKSSSHSARTPCKNATT